MCRDNFSTTKTNLSHMSRNNFCSRKNKLYLKLQYHIDYSETCVLWIPWTRGGHKPQEHMHTNFMNKENQAHYIQLVYTVGLMP